MAIFQTSKGPVALDTSVDPELARALETGPKAPDPVLSYLAESKMTAPCKLCHGNPPPGEPTCWNCGGSGVEPG